MSEETVIVCNPRSWPGQWVEGSTDYTCYQCGQEIGVAPSSWEIWMNELQEGNTVQFWCVPCSVKEARKRREDGANVEILPLTPSQRREIGDHNDSA